MGWSLVGTPQNASTGSGDVTVTLPTGTQDGDLLCYLAVARGDTLWSPPTGWTEVYSVNNANTTSGFSGEASVSVGYIVRTSSTPSNVWTRTNSGTAATLRVIVWAYRPDSGTVTYVDAAPFLDETAHTTTHSQGGISSLQSDDLIVAAWGNGSAYQHGGVDAVTDPATASQSPTATADTSTAPTSGTWLNRYILAFSGATSISALVADGVKSSAGATGDITHLSATISKSAGGAMAFRISGGGGGDTITVDDPTDSIVYEGAAGSASVTFSGTHTGATDNIEVQVEAVSDSSVVVAWTTLDTAVAAGAFSGSVSVPRGGWYIVKVRKASDTGVTDASSTQFGVGIVLGALGQSHLVGFTDDGTASATSRAVIHNGSAIASLPTTGVGQNAMAAALVSTFDCPVMFVESAASGTNVTYWYSSGGGTTAQYDAWAARVTAVGGDLSAFLWWQGDFNTTTGDTEASYTTLMTDLIGKVQTDFGASKIVIGALGRKGGGTDSAWEAIRDAHMAYAAGSADRRAFLTIDLEQQVDQQHFTEAAHIVAGNRIAQCIADLFGEATYSRGPVIASAAYSGAVVDVTITHDGGTDFTPTSGITGFRVLDNGTPATISSAVRQSATKVRLTCSASLSGPVTVQYGYGAYPDMSAPLVANSTLALPLRTTASDVTASSGISATSVTVTLTGATSLTGLQWAFFDDPLPADFGAPVAQGAAETTDGSDQIVIDITGSTLLAGDVGFLIVTNSDGTVDQSPQPSLAAGPVTVA